MKDEIRGEELINFYWNALFEKVNNCELISLDKYSYKLKVIKRYVRRFEAHIDYIDVSAYLFSMGL